MAKKTNDKKENGGEHRDTLSQLVVWFSVGGVIAVAILVMFLGSDPKRFELVLTATLPLFGAWVGTILAFYFGRTNFEAATRSVTDIAKTISPTEKLKSIPVKEKMRPRDQMLVVKKPDGEIGGIKLVDEILDKFTEEKNRMPILNDQDHPKYIVHRSAIEQYLVKKARQTPAPDLKALTLQNLLDDDADLKKLLETSFTTIKEDATLADAKLKMDPNLKIQDVFVTKEGKRNEPVIGWITNTKIQELATV